MLERAMALEHLLHMYAQNEPMFPMHTSARLQTVEAVAK